jgi:predicted nucleic acid-binding protein
VTEPVYLLDASVLIALVHQNHPAAPVANDWFSRVARFATCPITEGALVRFLVRTGETQSTAHATLVLVAARAGHEFWPDSLPYADADLAMVRGHRQVADAYLVALAKARGGRLATFDRPLADAYPATATLVS